VNVVDSSAWLEYFADGPNAPAFAAVVEDEEHLLVPTLTLFEVFKRACQLRGEDAALALVGVMLQGEVAELTASLALDAARVALDNRLPLADAVILATARARGAVLWTQDAHFRGLDGVEYREKPATP
jgi:predicted nucleic acid-binding protein